MTMRNAAAVTKLHTKLGQVIRKAKSKYTKAATKYRKLETQHPALKRIKINGKGVKFELFDW